MVSKIIDVAQKGVKFAEYVDNMAQKKIDANHETVNVPPPQYVSADAVGAIAKNIKSGSEIKFEPVSPYFQFICPYKAGHRSDFCEWR